MVQQNDDESFTIAWFHERIITEKKHGQKSVCIKLLDEL